MIVKGRTSDLEARSQVLLALGRGHLGKLVLNESVASLNREIRDKGFVDGYIRNRDGNRRLRIALPERIGSV